MRIAVLGSGYVGLVCGTCLSSFGHEVVCADSNARKIDLLNRGRIPIFEPGLSELIAAQTAQGGLTFTADICAGVSRADVVFLAVGTPPRADGSADLSFVHQCARMIAGHLQPHTVLVTKSTVPLGTGEEIEAILRKERTDGACSVASNPEFLREGSAIQDFLHPDRVVIGADDAHARAVVVEVYEPLRRSGVPIVVTRRRTAELIKYAANSFLATKIAFIGEIAELCEKAGADVEDVALGMGLDQRIGRKFLQAGPGYGGSCFPKDALALVASAKRFGASSRIVETVIAANDARKRAMVGKITESCGGSVRGKRIAVLGLTFKADTDDVRESPSLVIVPMLEASGAQVRAYDPAGMEQARKALPGLRMAKDAYSCAEQCDAVVILTEWEQFKQLDMDRIKAALRTPVLVDLRNIFDPTDMARRGFRYRGVGRPAPLATMQTLGGERLGNHAGTQRQAGGAEREHSETKGKVRSRASVSAP
jgi:UDPglucose 6-dehydrogenase